MRRLLVACVLVALPVVGYADDRNLWEETVHPGRRESRRLLAEGLKQAALAERSRSPATRERMYVAARRLFKQALRLNRNNTKALYALGRTQYELGDMKAAIVSLSAVRKRDPLYQFDYHIPFDLGIAYAKLEQWEKAVAQYDLAERILRSNTPSSNRMVLRARLLTNAAEGVMAIGRLPEAIQRYREALAVNSASVSAWWGLAVAHDRAGDSRRAMAAARRAIRGDPKMRALKGPSVFFIPDGEVNYYIGLGHWAAGERKKAHAAFEAFAKMLPNAPSIARVRQHLATLAKPLPKKPKKKWLAPRPSPASEAADAKIRDERRVYDQLKSRYYTLRRCYTRVRDRPKKPRPEGIVKIRLKVLPGRKKPTVKILSTAIKDKRFKSCMIERIGRRYFHGIESKKPFITTVELNFKNS